MHVVPPPDELPHGLKDANVRLHPDDDDRTRRHGGERARDLRFAAGVERHLRGGGHPESAELLRNWCHRVPEPLRILLACEDAHAELRRRIEQDARASREPLQPRGGHRRREPLLHVDDEENGRLGREAVHDPSRARHERRNVARFARASKRSTARATSLPAAS